MFPAYLHVDKDVVDTTMIGRVIRGAMPQQIRSPMTIQNDADANRKLLMHEFIVTCDNLVSCHER